MVHEKPFANYPNPSVTGTNTPKYSIIFSPKGQKFAKTQFGSLSARKPSE